MKYEDHLLMESAYNQISQNNSENIEEGLWDRLKGTGKGVLKGAERGFQSFTDPETSKFSDVGKAIKTGFSGGRSSSVISSHVQKLDSQIDDFIEDLKKVGNVTDESIANFDQASQFLKGIIKKLAKTSGRGSVSVTSLKGALGQAGFLDNPERGERGRFAKRNPEDTRERANVKI
jgi:hypothetical protein